ncbi:protein ASPARTIC PROTEASE IN GUARD CELL 1-like [Hevea brasiliensis]|uniref:protein ASPARTIC PROTEASE IN GUARD CELL 1-like n=1 Tax=Hevea brasiliensis TaxID=3981 RepID=UPI0025D1CD25|nr:protein ASPARTIC PROTEASE IN GUARD CELL 1-like [Hevea brasiliensis]
MDSESYALTSLARDEERLKHLTILPSVGVGQSPSSVVVPLFAESNGEHVVVLRIGEEKIRTQLLLDTGSSIIWWQCYPCEKCYNQKNIPKYNRMRSRSFESIRCSSNKCDQSHPDISCSPQGRCFYRIKYLDNDTTSGVLAIEELSSLDGRFSYKVIFGCGTHNPGKYFLGVYAGILGFQNLKYSFPTQIRAAKFSFCLITQTEMSTALYLYDFPTPHDKSIVVSLQRHPFYDFSFYYVEFKGISIHGEMLEVSPDKWEINSDGSYGVLLDTGTRITRFPREIYTQFRDKFVDETEDFVPLRVSYWGLDACYKTNIYYLNYFPEVSLHFTDEKVLHLDPRQVLYEVQTGVYCLAFAPLDRSLTMLGSYQLGRTRLSFNLAEHTVTFSSNDC